ncbi:hypothetical protein C1Y08_17400 [Pseudomonas sp. FW306-02-F02-AA]|nr:hypothetical protein C1Y07_21955 [Pseudomonas sp. FW306-02-F02-AB]PMZ08093.1 hypothetical protein C1Y06_21310 [Pseudomonas sp. FW306-02-H06C]PMZ14687.1 hypothetical protein C1Y08_17400 [Pseudomonas sp. FW306-02-F02-AA]PMZ20728.1 hypothetical protein C1Y09_17270 [Pseudomonas sp. FW306-02-F08-AA]PMZ25419.1 hypothetical protein C1Y05_23775 [Pseudomonas sp. FW306-02-F04-BA]PMZ32559.1 hypothetical protein C1X99_20865 [Pseudomonas sp. FW306-02-H06B]PMZ39369.1 hypothetical protein C1Y00_17230 [Ps
MVGYRHQDARHYPWRGSLLPLGRAAALKPVTANIQIESRHRFTAASQPSGSKLPRHGLASRPTPASAPQRLPKPAPSSPSTGATIAAHGASP